MFKNLLLTGWRNIRKHRFHTGLNVFGLSLGLGCALVLFQFISYHLGFDAYHRHAGSLYRVVTELHLEDGSVDYEKGAPLILGDALRREVPQVKGEAALLQKGSFTVAVPSRSFDNKPADGVLFAEHENVGFADRHWFELFDYQWEAGAAASALETPNTAVITRRLAKKYFGDADPVGQLIRIDGKHQIAITGVLTDYPPNTDFKTDLFISQSSFRNFYPDMDPQMRNNWQWVSSMTSLYVLLPAGVSQGAIDAAISNIARRNLGEEMASAYRFHLQPLKEVHFDERFSGVISRSLLGTLGLIALFLVLIACINFINLATAQQVKRAREIGTRKVLGSGPAAIFWQFMMETGLVVLLAALGAVCLLGLVLPALNNWLRLDLGFHFIHDGRLLLYFILLLILIAAAAGFYPAFILSRVRPIAALKNTPGNLAGSVRTSWQRKGLIILQNSCAQLLIVCALVITMQVGYMKNANLGFDKDAIVMVPLPDTAAHKLTALRNQLLSRADIKDVSFCFRAPASDANNGGSVRYDDRPWEKFTARSIMGDTHYLATFGLKLLAGRNLQESDTIREFLVNEDLMHKLGFRDPQQIIGHRLVAGDLNGDHPGVIAGVIRDFHYRSLYAGIDPVEISTVRENYKYAAIKLSGFAHGEGGGLEAGVGLKGGAKQGGEGEAGGGLKGIDRIWRSVYPENVFEYHFVNEQLENFYRHEDLLNKLVGAAAAIAIVISCLGLLGLISMLTLQRTKEIGIRKVVGASVGNILVMLSKDFLQLVVVAVMISIPIALWVMHSWLQRFAYRIPIPAWIFFASGVGGMCIALLTIGFHAIKAARANPVNSLRSD